MGIGVFVECLRFWIGSGGVQGLYRDGGKRREAKESGKWFSLDRASTVWTGGEIDAGEFEQELLPAQDTDLG